MLFLLACAATKPPIAAPEITGPTPPSAERLVFEPADEKVSPALWVDGVRHPLEYRVFAEDGQDIGGTPFGQLVDRTGKGFQQCNNQDFAALLVVEGQTFHLSHVECHPGATYLTEMDAEMTPVSTRPIDMSGVNGIALPCSGDVTPWNTLLSSEEYEADARKWLPEGGVSDNWQGFSYLAGWFEGDLSQANVYDYGWIPEVTVLDAAGTTQVVKHYAMGRFSHELGVVAPDEKTVYMSDDGLGDGFYRFVADTPKDLSAGELFAARFHADRVEWISLGHATNDEVDRSTPFDDMFTVDAEGCTEILTQWGVECLTLNEGMELQASRLETRRYAALLGATTEMSKAEGLAIDVERSRLYLAMSTVDYGMTRRDPAWDLHDHIQLPPNGCGAILQFELDESWTAGAWSIPLAGHPVGAMCSPDGISNPDNITMLGDLLMIAEDTRLHDPNLLWAWDPDDDSLTTVLSAEGGGAEVAGIHHHPDAGWFTVTEQHGTRGESPTKSAILGPIPEL
ncbi:MAG: DUF839 domain-containing protein [Proteobacteria bacterium]|nr:DUF839 domain-containing protein [Pseudomonadota bacterium]